MQQDHRPARHVLESLILDALTSNRSSFVLFSGGRDSSAVLAVAALVARREGLALPIPVIGRHAASPDSHETVWQEMVLDHLGIGERVVLDFDGEQRVLGEAARASIERLGLLWPAAAHVQAAILRHIGPGALMTGEGGDFVIDGLRMGDLRLPFHHGRPHRHELRRAARAVVPRSVVGVKRIEAPAWLTARGQATFRHAIRRNENTRLLWDRQVRHMYDVPFVIVGEAARDLVIADHGLEHHQLFTHPRFVSALAHEGGPLGFGSRTLTFRRLVGDLLPDAVISRRTKAAFNSTRWGSDEEDFARAWDGAGIDPEWVDHHALRQEWMSERRSSASTFLVQVAWHASQRLPMTQDPLRGFAS